MEIQLFSAPSILGLKPGGVEKLAEDLLAKGLARKIGAVRPVLQVPTNNHEYSAKRDSKNKCLNSLPARQFSITLGNYLLKYHKKGRFPLVLGGDCSILIGICPFLKSKGRYGLVFIDAHADYYLPSQSTTGELADMDLAIVTGRGPRLLTDIGNLRPYIKTKDVIHIGQRDAKEAEQFGSADIRKTAANCFDLAYLQRIGSIKAIQQISKLVNDSSLDGYWLHFDTDVIHDRENPAVEYRIPGGIDFKTCSNLMHQLMTTGKISGMSVTIFNPSLDPDGTIAAKIVACLAKTFTGVDHLHNTNKPKGGRSGLHHDGKSATKQVYQKT